MSMPNRTGPFPPAAVLQRKQRNAIGPAVFRPTPGIPGPLLIQRARVMSDPGVNYYLVPDPELYRNHVKQRITHFVTVMMMVWHTVLHAKGKATGKLRRMGSSVSLKAEAQAGVGCYNTPMGNVDAAHLMNTTVRSGHLKEGWVPSQAQAEMIDALNQMSGATTPQLKANNVGPDKKIDTCMSNMVTQWAASCDQGNAVPSAALLVKAIRDACLHSLNTAKKSANANYVTAIAGLQLVDERSAADVQRDYDIWVSKFI